MGKKNNQVQYEEPEEYSDEEDMDDVEEDEDPSEEEDEIKKLEKVVDWGKKKGAYYEEEDGKDSDEDKEEAEEEEAKLIEKLNNERLKSQDFFDVFGDQNISKEKGIQEEDEDTELQTQKYIKSKLKEMEGLAESEKVAFMKRESPETVNIVNELKTTLKEINLRLLPVINHVKANKNISKETQNYLDLRFNLLSGYSMNLCFYILLKLKEKPVQDHPVIQRIVQIKTQLTQLKTVHKMLEPQFNKILRKIEIEQTQAAQAIQVETKSPNQKKPTSKNVPITSSLTKIPISKNGQAKKNLYENLSSDDDSSDLGLDDGIDEIDSDEEEDYYRQVKKLKEDKREKINTQKRTEMELQFEDDPTHHVGDDDVRGINRKILKNKGLVRKRKKIDRNSRVKLRRKFEKAEVKLKSKGIVYRKDKSSYEGELTGVKAGLIKSRKLKDM